jgi:hypothetical protein
MCPELDITPVPEKYRRSTARRLGVCQPLWVFSCVDSIVTRQLIWEPLRYRAALFVDGRMRG